MMRRCVVLALAFWGALSVNALAAETSSRQAPLEASNVNASPKKPQVLDQIVAVVNNEVITRSELDERTDLISKQLKRQSGQLPDREVLKRQVLERMITDRALSLYARENGVRVDDAMLERAIQGIAEEGKTNLADLRKKVEGDGMAWSVFREEIRQEMMIARLRDREVDSKVVVTDAEVEALMKEEEARGGKEEELLLSHILITLPERMDPERVQRKEQRAREALARLQKGEPFAQVAAAYSDAQDALQGGSLGWRPLSRIPTIFASTAPQMKVGEISELLRSGNGFHIFAVMDRRGKSVAETVTQYHLREILMRLESNQPESEIRAKLSGVRARVMAGEDFSALAKLVSEDENRTKGGDIGWVAKGETFPEFDRVMVDLGPGQVSDIVKTQLGLHLVQVVEKRQTDLGEERRRVQAKQGVRARKVDEAFDEWVRQIRDSAFVDYRQSDGGAL